MSLSDEKATDDVDKKQKPKFQKSYFDVLGLCCSSEVVLIENILKNLNGVKDISVIVPSRTVIVVHDELLITSLQIVKALNQARLEANVRNRGEANYRNKWPSPYAVFCGILLVISLFQFVFPMLRWVSLAAVAVGIFPIAWRSVIALKNFTLDINILAIFAVIGTIILGDYLEAATIVFLFTIAEWLESRASHKATAVMSSLMNMAPQKATIAETGEVVDADDVKINTVIAIKAGEVVPIDGIVVEGESEVDEKTLTGESYPVPKWKDSNVLAGTMNLNGYITVKTTAIAEDCVVAKMAKLVEEAQNNKSKTQQFIDKCAKYYTPAVLLIAILVAVIPAAMRVHNMDHWYHLALVVLVSACPCGLILSTPVATFCALSKAATSGLLIKGGDYLETLAKIKTMAFDKTGTITRGEFVVSDFRSLRADLPLSKLLFWVSSIESKSSHPMATALVEHGRLTSIQPKPDEVDEYHSYPGEGIHGKIHGQHVYIGNKRMAARAQYVSGSIPEGESMEGKTVGYIYTGTSLAGMFSLSDTCRFGAAQAVNELKNMGIQTVMLTGDNQASANHAQAQLGNALDQVHAELLPEDKARIIEELKTNGRVAMIGDGINDAPALATADIGISMGIAGSALATETGNVILMSNDIRKVPEAIKLARRAHTKVVQNVILSIVTKGAILALAIAGHPLVWAAVLADVGTCLLVIFNSMLLLRGTSHHHNHGHGHDHGHGHHHGKGGCKKANAHDHHSHSHSHGCGSKHTKCDTKKDECGLEAECGSKCRTLVTEQSQSEKCCSSEAKTECCNDADLTHPDKTCCGEKAEKECCGEVADCCDDKGADAPHHHHLEDETNVCDANCDASKCSEIGISEKHTEEKTSKAVEESIIVVEEIQAVKDETKSHMHTHKASKCCEPKKAIATTNSSHCHKPHCSTDKPIVLPSCKKPHEATQSKNISCCNKKSQEPPTHCHPTDCHTHSEIDLVHACKTLGEKREMGGCCKSYRKECCAHNKRSPFGKGLSEIVIE